MAMTYAELKTNVQDITEMSFTDAQLSMFTKQAEQKIYGFIKDLPILKKTSAATFNASSGLSLPADVLYIHSVVQKTDNTTVNRKALISKDYDFLLEAYPLSAQEATVEEPEVKYYALDSDATANQEASRMTLILAPKWNTNVTLDVEYQYHPRSIVDTDVNNPQPWLGKNYDSALLNAVLVEAARFMKAEQDIIQLYDQQFVLAVQQVVGAVNLLGADSYRPKAVPAQPLTVPAPAQPPQRQG
jgi:hypothetical protein